MVDQAVADKTVTEKAVTEKAVTEKAVDAEPLSRKKQSGIHQGMPPLERAKAPVSFFEFWPGFVFYTPVAFQWLWLSIRYRGIGLPLVANPKIPVSGMVGEAKSDVFSQALGEAKSKIAPWILLFRNKNSDECLQNARKLLKEKNVEYPVVAKPDIGCRGVGVQVIKNDLQLLKYICEFPASENILLQKLVPYEAEAGVFYIRYPGSTKGEVFSITLKYQTYVFGDGKSTLKQLIEAEPRAGRLKHLYLPRHKHRLHEILPEGEAFRLAFTGSHSRGCIFRDGRKYITPELAKSLDQVADGLSEFHYGRFDIKFQNIDSLMKGEDYYILEVNGASSEAAHIWDCRSSLTDVFRVLFYQYRVLFELGAINRRRGFKPPSILTLVKSWWKEKKLVQQYPHTE